MANVHAFPIPTSGELNITLPSQGEITFTVFSLEGKVVGQGVASNNRKTMQLDLSPLQSGVYFISLIDKQERKYRVKLVKE